MKEFYIPDLREVWRYGSDFTKVRYSKAIYYYDRSTDWLRPIGTTTYDGLGIYQHSAIKLKVNRIL